MATTPASALFQSLDRYAAVQRLIDAGEAEGMYLECKSPTAPNLTRDQRASLARAISGFANTGGGVILWGVGTTRHSHGGLDVLSQIEAVGSAQRFAEQIDAALPGLSNPPIAAPQSTVLRRRATTPGE